MPFSGASSIPLCYLFFPATLLHQLFVHPLSPHLTIYFLVYLSIFVSQIHVQYTFGKCITPNTNILIHARTKKCYNERSSRTYYVRSSTPHCSIISPFIIQHKTPICFSWYCYTNHGFSGCTILFCGIFPNYFLKVRFWEKLICEMCVLILSTNVTHSKKNSERSWKYSYCRVKCLVPCSDFNHLHFLGGVYSKPPE